MARRETYLFPQTTTAEKQWMDLDRENAQQTIDEVEQVIQRIYEQNREASLEQRVEIKKSLSRIRNLVINFDETLIADSTVGAISEKVEEIYQSRLAQIQGAEKQQVEALLNHIREERKKFVEVMKKKSGSTSAVEYFYTKVLHGVDRDVLQEVYRQVVNEYKINLNVTSVINYFKGGGMAEMRFFVLSLNSTMLLEAYYQAYKQALGEGVNVMGLMGNQIHFTEDQVQGVYEHVTNENKREYIPENAIMFADSRESADLVEQGVNVVNIQGDCYDPRLLAGAYTLTMTKHWVKDFEELEQKSEMRPPGVTLEELQSDKRAVIQWVVDFRGLIRHREEKIKAIYGDKILSKEEKKRKLQDFLTEIEPFVQSIHERRQTLTDRVGELRATPKGGTI